MRVTLLPAYSSLQAHQFNSLGTGKLHHTCTWQEPLAHRLMVFLPHGDHSWLPHGYHGLMESWTHGIRPVLCDVLRRGQELESGRFSLTF